VLASAKSGMGIEDILNMICKIIPPPADRRKEPLR
jgi:translation elongation factor EF-4